jgi:Ca2+-binding RTX toxin-like protein
MRHPSLRPPLTVERLEDRAVPAGFTAALQNGVLSILGTPGDDQIIVRQVLGSIVVDGAKAKFPAAAVNRIVIDAGSGNDTVRLDSQNLSGQPLTAPAVVYGGDGNDAVTGTNRGDQVFGQNGNDTISGGGGRNYLSGGAGDDQVLAGAAGDLIAGGGGFDSLTGGAGNDTISGDAGDDVIDGGPGADRLSGDAGNDRLYGRAGADAVDAGGGNDYLDAGAGNDQVIGGPGRDALNGGEGFDTFRDDYGPPAAGATPAAVAASIADKAPGDARYALPEDIHQQIADTCSLLASLTAVARTSPADLAARVRYDAARGQYLVPLFVNGQWTDVPVSFNGAWTDNEPYPGPDDGTGARDYWPIVYQRAYLQAENVDTTAADAHQWAVRGTTASQLTAQRWRYPEVALAAVTGRPVGADSQITDADLATIQAAVAAGRTVIANTWTVESQRSRVAGTGLVFSHTYAVVDVTSDAQGPILTLRNPWGIDNSSTNLRPLSPAVRAFLTSGRESDGLVQVRWDTFKQAFATYVYEQGA